MEHHSNITIADVENALDRRGYKYKTMRRYIVTQCPTHEDRNPSAQIFINDWFVNCLASCGRYHITKAFPELYSGQHTHTYNSDYTRERYISSPKVNIPTSHNIYKTFDLYSKWKDMPLIPRDHTFKNIPLEFLDEVGWRWDNNSYFIPYFTPDKKHIPFAQWRHLTGERRFTFLKDAQPTVYGKWNLIGNPKVFICEGTSDTVTLEYCFIPAVGLPSASSGELIKKLSQYCHENDISLIYGGDNDSAGDKLKESLDLSSSYRRKQPPKEYKDWSDFYMAAGRDAVFEYCMMELDDSVTVMSSPVSSKKLSVYDIFPGAERLS